MTAKSIPKSEHISQNGNGATLSDNVNRIAKLNTDLITILKMMISFKNPLHVQGKYDLF